MTLDGLDPALAGRFRPDPALAAFGHETAAREVVSAQIAGRRRTALGEWVGSSAMATLGRDDWDSEVLRRACGRVDLWAAPGVPSAEAAAFGAWVADSVRAAVLDYVVCRLPAADVAPLQALEALGWRVVDVLETFAETPRPAPVDGVRPHRPEDRDEVLAIGRESFEESRFATDPVLGPDVSRRVHDVWTRNSLHGLAAREVLVAEGQAGGAVEGFLTCQLRDCPGDVRIGTIALVATAGHARGRGVGRRLVEASVEWFRGQGCALVTVGTQASNAAALRLYENAGFRAVSTSVTLRWARGEAQV